MLNTCLSVVMKNYFYIIGKQHYILSQLLNQKLYIKFDESKIIPNLLYSVYILSFSITHESSVFFLL